MTTPSIRVLRESFPEASLTFLTEQPSDQVLKDNPFLDEILIRQKSESFLQSVSFLKEIRKLKFDCVIDFFGNPRSAMVTRFSGAPIRIGFNFRGRRLAYTHSVDINSELTYAAKDKALLLEPLGIFSKNLELVSFYRIITNIVFRINHC